MAKVKCGLIQMGLKGDGTMEPGEIRDRMIEAHIPYIEDAARQGVQVLCFQEVFTQPYFCPSQDRKWYAAAEPIPDGHTTRLMQEYAKKHAMVMVVPIYEEHMTGVYYNPAAVIDAANADDTVQRLEDETAAARALGIFGSPTFAVDAEIFWGDDRLEDALAWSKR